VNVDALAAIARPFARRPLIAVAALAAIAVVAAVGWYLGSPLFIRTMAEETFDGAASTVARGELNVIDDVHHGRGTVRIAEADGRRYVRFENVSIANGPDLHVYLSTDTGGRYAEANARYLGPLRATDGSFQYEIPASLDVSMYRSVVVWCRAFATLFTWADLTR